MNQQIYYNGNIITMDNKHMVEAVLVQDGKILQTGSVSDIMDTADRTAQRIDLDGACMLPAFIDSHSHFTAMANTMLQAQLDNCKSFDEIASALTEFVRDRNIPAGQWVFANGYDHNSLAERRHPDKSVLDRALASNPVVIQHKSGHMGVFNSLGLSRLGVDGSIRQMSGGKIAIENGSPTGYMEETAFVEYLKRAPMPSPKEFISAYRAAQDRYASFGITTVQEGMMPVELIPLYKQLLSEDVLKLDVIAYADPAQSDKIFSEFPGHIGRSRRHFKIGGYKILLDGSPQGRTAWMREPYKDDGNYCGYASMPDEKVYKYVKKAARDGMQILAHCNGDAACAQYIETVERLSIEGFDMSSIRPVIIHSQLIGRDQLKYVSRLRMMISFFVAHVYHWGDTHIQNFGMERASHISPAKSALDSGIKFTLHQDSPVVQPDMLETIWCAVQRRTKSGIELGADERISVHEAIKAVTLNAAYQYFEENEKGSIEKGKNADFVILDKDLHSVPADEIRKIRVLATIKDGKAIYQA